MDDSPQKQPTADFPPQLLIKCRSLGCGVWVSQVIPPLGAANLAPRGPFGYYGQLPVMARFVTHVRCLNHHMKTWAVPMRWNIKDLLSENYQNDLNWCDLPRKFPSNSNDFVCRQYQQDNLIQSDPMKSTVLTGTFMSQGPRSETSATWLWRKREGEIGELHSLEGAYAHSLDVILLAIVLYMTHRDVILTDDMFIH